MKKCFTVLEMVVYIFIISIVGIYIAYIASKFFDSLTFNKNISNFSKNYDALLGDFYSNAYNGWVLYSGAFNDSLVSNSIVLYNSGVGYLGYSCLSTGIVSTNISTGDSNIVWTGYNNIYSGFDCNSISGSLANSGFWLNLDINLSQRNIKLNYYLQN